VAGVKASPLVAALPLEHDRSGRIKVDEFMRVPGYDGVYAIGDDAHQIGEDGEPLSPTAQVAVQQGPALARNLVAEWEGRPLKPFKFHYRGDLVSIGTLDAVCCPYGWNVFGFTGWLLFKWVYFSKMPTMQNRFRLLSDWVLHGLQGPTVARLEGEEVEEEKSEVRST
jgi:NADH:ubiquinone reductase (H+-translocating)